MTIQRYGWIVSLSDFAILDLSLQICNITIFHIVLNSALGFCEEIRLKNCTNPNKNWSEEWWYFCVKTMQIQGGSEKEQTKESISKIIKKCHCPCTKLICENYHPCSTPLIYIQPLYWYPFPSTIDVKSIRKNHKSVDYLYQCICKKRVG